MNSEQAAEAVIKLMELVTQQQENRPMPKAKPRPYQAIIEWG